MTNRIGNKDEAHQRSKEEKARIKASNIAQEAVKKAAAAAKYHNEIKGHPRSAATTESVKDDKPKTAAKTVKAKPAKPATKTTKAAKTVKAAPKKAAKTTKASKSTDKAGSDKATADNKKK